jgi:hypothetical protein
MRKSKSLEGEVVGPNDYDKVVAVMKKDPKLGIMEACAKANVEYHKYHYYKPKDKKKPRSVVVSKNSRSMVVPKMQTFEVPEQRAATGKVIALVGNSADVTQALRDLLRQ